MVEAGVIGVEVEGRGQEKNKSTEVGAKGAEESKEGQGKNEGAEVGVEGGEESKERQENDAVHIPVLRAATRGNERKLGITQKAQPRIMRVTLTKRLPGSSRVSEPEQPRCMAHLGAHAVDMGARAKLIMAWVACKCTTPNDTMAFDLHRETLARYLGSHDTDRASGSEVSLLREQEALPDPLIRSRGGTRTHAHSSSEQLPGEEISETQRHTRHGDGGSALAAHRG